MSFLILTKKKTVSSSKRSRTFLLPRPMRSSNTPPFYTSLIKLPVEVLETCLKNKNGDFVIEYRMDNL